jgi:hypothetical protein
MEECQKSLAIIFGCCQSADLAGKSAGRDPAWRLTLSKD